MNKRQMYNRIMESVDKEVKKALLNEDINNDIIERLPTEEELRSALQEEHSLCGSYGEFIIISEINNTEI